MTQSSRSKSQNITRSDPFAAIIKKGNDGNILAIKSQAYYRHQLNKFKDGTEVTLEIHTRKPKRTDAQNRYYWGVYLPEIAECTGERNLDRLHELFKGKFLTEGIVEVLGQRVRMKKSTTDLGIYEFSQYIMDIEAETGVIAPPTENYGLTSLSEGVKISNEKEDELVSPQGGSMSKVRKRAKK